MTSILTPLRPQDPAHFATLRPMLPVTADTLPTQDGLAYEVKWDGIRILCHVHGGAVSLITRNGHDRTALYGELVTGLSTLTTPCVVDGEIVSFDEAGRPSFTRVLARDRGAQDRRGTVCLVAFDVLRVRDEWLTARPWSARRAILDELVKCDIPALQCSPVHTDGALLWTATASLGLEGIVIKERDGYYYPGKRHPTWRKMRHLQHIDALVIGLVLAQDRPRSLLLAACDDEPLYIGRVFSGVPEEILQYLFRETLADPRAIPPWVGGARLATQISRPLRGESYRFAPNPLRIVVRYLEWTDAMTLRQPVFERLVTGGG